MHASQLVACILPNVFPPIGEVRVTLDTLIHGEHATRIRRGYATGGEHPIRATNMLLLAQSDECFGLIEADESGESGEHGIRIVGDANLPRLIPVIPQGRIIQFAETTRQITGKRLTRLTHISDRKNPCTIHVGMVIIRGETDRGAKRVQPFPQPAAAHAFAARIRIAARPIRVREIPNAANLTIGESLFLFDEPFVDRHIPQVRVGVTNRGMPGFIRIP